MSQIPVQSKSVSQAGASTTTVLDYTPTAGNVLVAIVYNHLGSTITFPNFPGYPQSAAWTQDVSASFGTSSDSHVSIWRRLVTATELTSVSVSCASATQMDVHVIELPGTEPDQTQVLDATTTASSTTSSVTSLSTGTTATTTDTNEIAIAASGQRSGNGGSAAWTGSFTVLASTSYLLSAYKILSSTQTVTTTPSWHTARPAGAVLATYEAAAVAPSDPFPAGYTRPTFPGRN